MHGGWGLYPCSLLVLARAQPGPWEPWHVPAAAFLQPSPGLKGCGGGLDLSKDPPLACPAMAPPAWLLRGVDQSPRDGVGLTSQQPAESLVSIFFINMHHK